MCRATVLHTLFASTFCMGLYHQAPSHDQQIAAISTYCDWLVATRLVRTSQGWSKCYTTFDRPTHPNAHRVAQWPAGHLPWCTCSRLQSPHPTRQSPLRTTEISRTCGQRCLHCIPLHVHLRTYVPASHLQRRYAHSYHNAANGRTVWVKLVAGCIKTVAPRHSTLRLQILQYLP